MVTTKADINTVRARVQGMLTDMGSVMIDRDGDFSFSMGSTRVFIRVIDLEEFTVVNVWAPVLQNVPLSPELFKYVAEATSGFVFGHLQLFTSDGVGRLDFGHHILGDYVDSEEIRHTVLAVATTADDLDDELKSRFGGLRFTDG